MFRLSVADVQGLDSSKMRRLTPQNDQNKNIDNGWINLITLAAMARKYLARKAPDAEDQSFPLFLESAWRAASTASSTSSAVAAGISPKQTNIPQHINH